MKRYAFSLVFCLLTGSVALAQTKPSIEGVWKVAELVAPGKNPEDKGTARAYDNPEPGLLIFTKGYYSAMGVEGPPRARVDPPKDPKNLTDAEKIARYEQWRQFVANAGTYEIKESTLTMRAMVAKNPNRIDRPGVWEIKLEGASTLWLIPIAEAAATEPRVKLTRVE